MATGTVKWFNPTKGYGFIQPDNGGKDVFVHISAVEKAGLSGLNEGAKVSYEVVANRGKEFRRKPEGRLNRGHRLGKTVGPASAKAEDDKPRSSQGLLSRSLVSL